jgi:hypothetical protein
MLAWRRIGIGHRWTSATIARAHVAWRNGVGIGEGRRGGAAAKTLGKNAALASAKHHDGVSGNMAARMAWRQR